MNFIALDFETANYSRHSACAIGIAVITSGVITQTASWLIRPPSLAFQFTYLHGISADDVRHQPTFEQLWPTLKPLLDGKLLVAHNVPFDKSVLEKSLEYYGLPQPAVNFICSLEIARKTWPRLGSHKLDVVADHLGIRLKHHDAQDDSHSAAQIVLQAGQHHQVNTTQELIKNLNLKVHELRPEFYGIPSSTG